MTRDCRLGSLLYYLYHTCEGLVSINVPTSWGSWTTIARTVTVAVSAIIVVVVPMSTEAT